MRIMRLSGKAFFPFNCLVDILEVLYDLGVGPLH